MGRIYGTTNYNNSAMLFYLDWVEDQINAATNTSRLSVSVYAQRIGTFTTAGYTSAGASGNNAQALSFNGGTSNGTANFDGTNFINLINRVQTITHNADGSKTVPISVTSQLGVVELGFVGSSDFHNMTGTISNTITLSVIDRAARITNTPNFEMENNIPLTFSNPGGFNIKTTLLVEDDSAVAQQILVRQHGVVTSDTIILTPTEINTIYSHIVQRTSANIILVCQTFSDGAYTVQVGGNQNKNAVVTLNPLLILPIFTDFDISNVDKNIPVVDKYGNTLITSSTSTLLGADTRMIRGYSKIRARITAANKAVAQKSATMLTYRLVNALQQITAAWSSGSTVDLEIDNAQSLDGSVTAFDSRTLNTTVTKSLSVSADFVPLSISSILLTRDNSIDATTKLAFTGSLWKKYFGSNSPSSAVGVLNALIAAYRFKNSTNSWTTQNGTITVTIAAPGRVTKTAHGLATGDVVHFTTTGTLPTGITASTAYFVIKDDADHFWLATTSANATAGTKITTTGSQSGVHTLNVGSPWTTITPTVDSGGAISFNDYVNGDLGASGFDANKSFDVEVRGYDKLSQTIVESSLGVGVPVQDWTSLGTSIKGQYSETEGGAFQIRSLDIEKGWFKANETWAYASATTITVPSDATLKYSVGDKIRWKQGGSFKHAYIVSRTSTVLTVFGDAVTNSGITDNHYSRQENPYGFPDWFDVTLTSSVSGGTAPSYSTVGAKVSVKGRTAKLQAVNHNSSGGTAGAGGNSIIFALPITAANSDQLWRGTGHFYNGGTTDYLECLLSSTTGFVLVKGTTAFLTGAEQNNAVRFLDFELEWQI